MWQSNSGPDPEREPKFIDRIYHFFIDNVIHQVKIRNDLEKEIMTKDGYLKSILTVTSITSGKANQDDFSQFIKILYKALLARKGNGIYSNWIKEYDLTLIYENLEIKNV